MPIDVMPEAVLALGMRVSVCIATYNTLAFTRKCLQSLVETSEGLVDEVIVVDDLSRDGTREYLDTLGPPFTIIHNDANCGYAYNNNLAARMAGNDCLCLLNSDTVLRPGWAAPMLKILTGPEKVGFVGNVQWSPTTKRYDHMGVVIGRNLIPSHFGDQWNFVPFRDPKEWIAVTAACCMIRKSVFLEAGGFDEGFHNGYEDTDLCLRLGQRGYRHFVTYQSRIDHYVGGSPGRKEREQENQRRFLNRWSETLKTHYTPRMARLDAVNYLVRYLDRPWKYNGAKFLNAWRNATHADTAVSLPKLWPHG